MRTHRGSWTFVLAGITLIFDGAGRVATGDLVVNGGFDAGLSSWTVVAGSPFIAPFGFSDAFTVDINARNNLNSVNLI